VKSKAFNSLSRYLSQTSLNELFIQTLGVYHAVIHTFLLTDKGVIMEEIRLNGTKDRQISDETTPEKESDASKQNFLGRKGKKIIVGTNCTNPSDFSKPLSVRRGINLKIVVKGPEMRNKSVSAATAETKVSVNNRSNHRRSGTIIDSRFFLGIRNHNVTYHTAPTSHSRLIARDLDQQYLQSNYHYLHRHYQEQCISCRSQKRIRSKLTPACKEIV
jgi:hypothetical protein